MEPKVTVEFVNLVRVACYGESTMNTSDTGRDDGGFLNDFTIWMGDQRIKPIYNGASGPGISVMYFDPKDAEKIESWVMAHPMVKGI